MVGTVCDYDYVSVGNLWLSKKKLLVTNIFTVVVLIMFLLAIYGLVKSC